MMGDSERNQEETSVLRWGGLAGVLGSIIFIVVFAVVIVFVGADPAEAEGLVVRHPDIRAARIVENSLYLLVLVLWIPHVLALQRVLPHPLQSRRGMEAPHSVTSPGATIDYAADTAIGRWRIQ
jgi:hypothetical protein